MQKYHQWQRMIIGLIIPGRVHPKVITARYHVFLRLKIAVKSHHSNGLTNNKEEDNQFLHVRLISLVVTNLRKNDVTNANVRKFNFQSKTREMPLIMKNTVTFSYLCVIT